MALAFAASICDNMDEDIEGFISFRRAVASSISNVDMMRAASLGFMVVYSFTSEFNFDFSFWL